MRNFIYIFLCMSLNVHAIDFVTVGNPSNLPASNGKGTVSTIFKISKYEITNEEYCIFLNNVAKSDKYGLFSPLMQEHFFGGIIRSGDRGHYIYTCKKGYEKKPITGITWMSAIRFINWLHYNSANIEKGESLAKYIPLTEGDNTHGAYDTRNVPVIRNKGANYWLPNEDEWLKAAYYDGNKWNEHLFSKGSNCYTKKGWAYPFPHIKDVGEGVVASHYGTFDQQGNVAEWIENTPQNGSKWKLALGGSLIRPTAFAAFKESEGDFPEKSISTFGFRVCRALEMNLQQKTPIPYTPKTLHKQVVQNVRDKLGNVYVRIADSRNDGDIVNQFKGQVNYEYLIARTELSNASYCRFLNAVATISDQYGLYDVNMAIGACGGIYRIKKNGKFRYFCKKGWENRPIVYVKFYDIARFANWMHYGCPNTGKSEIGTTEGTYNKGAYNTSDFEEVRSGKKAPYPTFGKRNKGARYWIPSENEWYKAAYYDPQLIGNRKYHDYPTRTSDAPLLSEANYMVNNHFSVGAPYFVAPVDSFANSPSYYGTLQQGGNVWEWIEDWQYGIIGNRGLRGGSWSYTSYGLNACNTDPGGLDNSGYVFGARLCKSANESGWYPVETPLIKRLYQKILLMPQKHLIFAMVVLLVMAIVSIILIFTISVKYIIKKR